MSKYLVDGYKEIIGCETPENLYLSWEAGFDFPEDMYEPIRILAETYLYERQDEIRNYFFWGKWEDEALTIPVEDRVDISIAPYSGYMHIVFKRHYKKGDEFIDLDEASSFPTPFEVDDKNKKSNLAVFRVGYDGAKSTIEERQNNKSVYIFPPIVRVRKKPMNEILQERQKNQSKNLMKQCLFLLLNFNTDFVVY